MSKWIIVALAAVVVIATSSILLSHAFVPASPPGLTITGTNVVRDGGIMHLHGQGFSPGGSVALTIDNGLPVSLTGQYGTWHISQGTERSVNVAGQSQMFILGELLPRSVADTNITVSSSGTFDANVTVPLSLPAGKHTIHAAENQGSQSASLEFTVPSSELAVNPTALNFGSVEVGMTVRLSVTVSNQGGASLHWTATIEGSHTNWLTLPDSAGVIETNSTDETVTVTANTTGLAVGSHSATLRIHSDNGDVQVPVSLNVIPHAQGAQQAIINVPQQNLDFGQLQAGQQVQQSISIANLGDLPLNWQASTNAASASWLALATSRGTVQPGAVPQTVQVTVNTTSLAAGSYAGTINITSNGGNATVMVTFGVIVGTPMPSPSPSPSSSPSLSPSPTMPPALSITVSGNCPPDSSGNFICTDTLAVTGSQGSISWSVSGESDLPGTTFNPPGGTLSTGQSQPVTVTIPPGDCPAGGHYDYTWPGNSFRVTFICQSTPTPTPTPTQIPSPTPTPAPQITVTPAQISSASGNCSQNSDGTYNCTVVVGETSAGDLKWFSFVGIGGTGTSINPSSGQLTASQPQQKVTISTIPCSNGSFTFMDQNNIQATVTWTCP